MNGHEVWRLRELGIGGFQVQTQESNFWSKYNCPVLQWTADNPRHGFSVANTTKSIAGSITVYLRRDSSHKRSADSSSEPPAKQRKMVTQEGSTSSAVSIPTQTPSANPNRSLSWRASTGQYKGDWYFLNSSDSLRASCAAAFPQFAQEHHIDLGHSNKIFAARWLSDDRIVMGTKCNSILVLDASARKLIPRRRVRSRVQHEDEADSGDESAENQRYYYGWESSPIVKLDPLKGTREPPPIDQHCGIHAIDVNPSGTLFASGGDNPADVSIFRLPNFEPLTVGETAHNDWLFDLEWLDDEYLVSGSRDSTLALWKFPNNPEDMIVCSHSNRVVKSQERHGVLSENRMGSFGSYTSLVTQHYGCSSYPSSRPIEIKKLQRFEKVRALKFNHRHRALTSVSLNSYLHVLDINTFKQKLLRRMDGYQECVCLCNSPDEDLLTVGSRTSFTFYDTRTWERVGDEKLPRRIDEDPHSLQSMMPSGVRSASWRGHMLTLGTGGGEIMFYDVRAKKFLQCDCNRSLTLKITGGWLQQDEVYQELFLNLPCPNAVYAHCYDQYGTRLFAAGGPIASSLVGNYAAMWG